MLTIIVAEGEEILRRAGETTIHISADSRWNKETNVTWIEVLPKKVTLNIERLSLVTEDRDGGIWVGKPSYARPKDLKILWKRKPIDKKEEDGTE